LRKAIFALLSLSLCLALAAPVLAQQEQVVTEQGYVVFRIGDPRCFVKGPNAEKFGPYVRKRPAQDAPDVTVVNMDAAPYIRNDRTFVPVRFLANALGVADANVSWDGSIQQVTLAEPGMPVVQMIIGSKVIASGGQEKEIDVAPELVPPGRTMLPARHVAEALGYTVDWDPRRPDIVLCWKGKKPTPEDLKVLDGELAWKMLGGDVRNPIAVPPGSKVAPATGAYVRDGVFVRRWDNDTVSVGTWLPFSQWNQPEPTLAIFRAVLEQTFGPDTARSWIDGLVEELRLKYTQKQEVRYRIEPAPDGRLAMICDDGGGIEISIKPPGEDFPGLNRGGVR